MTKYTQKDEYISLILYKHCINVPAYRIYAAVYDEIKGIHNIVHDFHRNFTLICAKIS